MIISPQQEPMVKLIMMLAFVAAIILITVPWWLA